jgi:ankyrin repeat protein
VPDIEAKDNSNRTPLLCAAGNGHGAVAKVLLDKGADTEAKDNSNQTPLLCAARYGHEAVAKVLLDNGVDFDSKDDIYGLIRLL